MVFRPYTSRVESGFGSFRGKRNAQQIEIRHHYSAAFVFEQSRRSSSRSHNTSGESQQHDREVRRPTAQRSTKSWEKHEGTHLVFLPHTPLHGS